MLTIDQVKPHLASSDSECRRLAEDYFKSHSHPLLSADEWWAVFDATNEVPGHLHFHEVMASRQSAESIRRLIKQANASPGFVNAMGRPERGLLSYLPLAPVREFFDLLLAGLTHAEHRALIRNRLAIDQQPPEQLWADLQVFAKRYDDKAYSEIPVDLNDLEDALIAHADFTLPRALQTVEAVALTPSDDHGWLPVFAINLIGKLRHVAAVDLLLKVLEGIEDPENSATASQCCQAILRFGESVSLPATEAFFDRHPATNYTELAETIAEFRTEATERFLARMLVRQTDDMRRTCIALSLTDMLTTSDEARDAFRDMVNEDRWDTIIADPLPLLIALSDITGWSPPELPQWRELARSEERNQMLKQRYDQGVFGNDPKTLAMIEELRAQLADYDDDPPGDPDLAWAERPVPDLLPLRAEPKVGRNDPCPCGSGKKYKKCCLK